MRVCGEECWLRCCGEEEDCAETEEEDEEEVHCISEMGCRIGCVLCGEG